MVVNSTPKEPYGHVKFISYTGKYPNLCSGTLVLEIDGQQYTFTNNYYALLNPAPFTYPKFWFSGGTCGFAGGNYQCAEVTHDEWEIDVYALPEELKKYADEIDEVFNENVRHGCCGGCL